MFQAFQFGNATGAMFCDNVRKSDKKGAALQLCAFEGQSCLFCFRSYQVFFLWLWMFNVFACAW